MHQLTNLPADQQYMSGKIVTPFIFSWKFIIDTNMGGETKKDICFTLKHKNNRKFVDTT